MVFLFCACSVASKTLLSATSTWTLKPEDVVRLGYQAPRPCMMFANMYSYAFPKIVYLKHQHTAEFYASFGGMDPGHDYRLGGNAAGFLDLKDQAYPPGKKVFFVPVVDADNKGKREVIAWAMFRAELRSMDLRYYDLKKDIELLDPSKQLIRYNLPRNAEVDRFDRIHKNRSPVSQEDFIYYAIENREIQISESESFRPGSYIPVRPQSRKFKPKKFRVKKVFSEFCVLENVFTPREIHDEILPFQKARGFEHCEKGEGYRFKHIPEDTTKEDYTDYRTRPICLADRFMREDNRNLEKQVMRNAAKTAAFTAVMLAPGVGSLYTAVNCVNTAYPGCWSDVAVSLGSDALGVFSVVGKAVKGKKAMGIKLAGGGLVALGGYKIGEDFDQNNLLEIFGGAVDVGTTIYSLGHYNTRLAKIAAIRKQISKGGKYCDPEAKKIDYDPDGPHPIPRKEHIVVRDKTKDYDYELIVVFRDLDLTESFKGAEVEINLGGSATHKLYADSKMDEAVGPNRKDIDIEENVEAILKQRRFNTILVREADEIVQQKLRYLDDVFRTLPPGMKPQDKIRRIIDEINGEKVFFEDTPYNHPVFDELARVRIGPDGKPEFYLKFSELLENGVADCRPTNFMFAMWAHRHPELFDQVQYINRNVITGGEGEPHTMIRYRFVGESQWRIGDAYFRQFNGLESVLEQGVSVPTGRWSDPDGGLVQKIRIRNDEYPDRPFMMFGRFKAGIKYAVAEFTSKVYSKFQKRHIKGTKDWEEAGKPSYFASEADAQRVLDAYRNGQAETLGPNSQGFPIVRLTSVVGYENSPHENISDLETSVFVISGTEKISVIPHRSDWQHPFDDET